MQYELEYSSARDAQVGARAEFIRRTYAHLAGAIFAFIGLEAILLNSVDPQALLGFFAQSRFAMLIVMVAFIGAGWIADSWARSETSPTMQYMGLGLYVLAEALIFLPILMLASNKFDGIAGINTPHYKPTVIPTAGLMTLMVAGGLTLSVFVTRKDYSFMGPVLCVGSMLAFGFIIAAMIFGFNLGMVFSFAMVALMSGYILYQTSQVMLHFRTDQHVAAALMLFASIATLFWYILRIVMAFSNRD